MGAKQSAAMELAVRLAKTMTQKKAAERAGVTPQSLCAVLSKIRKQKEILGATNER